jgi:hypothetical protein
MRRNNQNAFGPKMSKFFELLNPQYLLFVIKIILSPPIASYYIQNPQKFIQALDFLTFLKNAEANKAISYFLSINALSFRPYGAKLNKKTFYLMALPCNYKYLS